METAHELIAQAARQSARESLENARNTLERALREMDGYLAKFDDAATDRDRARVINWSINHLVANIQPNLRIDLLADSQSELTKLG